MNDMNIDWTLIPKRIIDIGNLTNPYDICRLLKHWNIDWYLYRINYKGIVLKYGMSADNSKNHGDRLYRQIAHASCWNELQNHGSSGRDFRGTEESLFKAYGIQMEREFLTVTVWDVTKYPFVTINPAKEVEQIESVLIQQHIDATGHKPIGNIEHKKYLPKQPGIPAALYNRLFTEY